MILNQNMYGVRDDALKLIDEWSYKILMVIFDETILDRGDTSRGCSLNIAFFFREFSIFCNLYFASTWPFLVVQKK